MMTFDPERIQHRVEGMSEDELLTWLSLAIPGMQRHLEVYERSRDADHLGELALAEMTANLVITELMERKFPRSVESEELPVVSASSGPETDTATTSVPRRFRRRRRVGTGIVPAHKEGTSD